MTSPMAPDTASNVFVAVELGGRTPYVEGRSSWVELTVRHAAQVQRTRFKACDLRVAQRVSTRLHAEVDGRVNIAALVDVDVLVAADVRGACAQLEDLVTLGYSPRQADSLRYAGTPTALAGLIVDIVTAGVADGVTLRPLTTATLRHIVNQTLPELQTAGLLADPRQMARLCAPHTRSA